MYSKVLLSVAALSAPALAAPSAGRFGCASEPSAAFIQASAEMAIQEQSSRVASYNMSRPAIGVNTYFHIVTSSEGSGPDDATMQEQLNVLNQDFAPHEISFTLAGTTRTVNPSWARDGDELAMKQELRQGSYSDLNVYFLEEVGGAFGYCYFPTEAPEGSEELTIDGCSILATTVPGGSEENYNEGRTVTHEVGHWFGLFHTFQGGCADPGDSISDTPAQESPTTGCPTGRDSCPSQEGVDPIHNYMDYSYDSCYEEFTEGQSVRMQNMWAQYRG